ncbi:MAG: SusE domain-containing protein [Alistipes finegoldii]
MRRKLYYLTAGLAATLLLAAACSSDDTAEKPVPEPATLTAPTLTLSADAVLVDPEHSDQPALHAEWTAATDDEQTEVAYTLYVNLTDRDMFSGPVVIDKGAALTHDFTHGELNQLLLNTFDLEAGTEAAVRFAVYAKNADEEFDAQLSEIKNCAITPKTTYPELPALADHGGCGHPVAVGSERGPRTARKPRRLPPVSGLRRRAARAAHEPEQRLQILLLAQRQRHGRSPFRRTGPFGGDVRKDRRI